VPQVASDPIAVSPSYSPASAPNRTVSAQDSDSDTPFAQLLDDNSSSQSLPPSPPPQRDTAPRSDQSDQNQQAAAKPSSKDTKSADNKPADSKDAAPAKTSDAAQSATQDSTKDAAAAAKAATGKLANGIKTAEQTKQPKDAKTDATATTTVIAPQPAQTTTATAVAVATAADASVPTTPDSGAAAIASDATKVSPQLAALQAALSKDALPAAADKDADQTKAQAATAPSPDHADGKSQLANAIDGNKDAPAHAEPDATLPHAAHAETAAPATAAADTPASVTQATNDQAQQTAALNAPAAHTTAIATNQSAPAATTMQAAAVPLAGLAVEIANKAVAGTNHFEIRLDPPELGRIEVRLDVDRDGNVTSRMIADRSDTLDLLRRDSSGLERAFQDAGLKTADNGLQFSLRDQSMNQGNQQQNAPSNSAQLVIPDDTLPVISATQLSYGRRAGLGSGVDIRI
jgi:flagellar hook-length control protein FliK